MNSSTSCWPIVSVKNTFDQQKEKSRNDMKKNTRTIKRNYEWVWIMNALEVSVLFRWLDPLVALDWVRNSSPDRTQNGSEFSRVDNTQYAWQLGTWTLMSDICRCSQLRQATIRCCTRCLREGALYMNDKNETHVQWSLHIYDDFLY